MAYIDATDYKASFEAFKAGEIFDSPEPTALATLDREVLHILQNKSFQKLASVVMKFGSISSPEFLQNYLSGEQLEALAIASDTFYKTTDSNEASVDFRFGLFERDSSGNDHKLARAAPHIDAIKREGKNHPVFTTSMSIGKPTLAFVGKAVKRPEHALAAQIIGGSLVRLEEGTVYRFEPLSVHSQPRPGIVPVTRYFWRHFHSRKSDMAQR